MTAITPLAIVGAGGFGREVPWLVDDINGDRPRYELLGFIDDAATQTVEGRPVIGTTEQWLAARRHDVALVCAVGEPTTRKLVAERLTSAGFGFATLVHPTVKRSRWVELGPGCMICADNVLTTNIRIGAHVLLNLDCTVGHDSVLEDYSSLMPGCHISGEVYIETGAYLGTGAVIINGVRIGAWSVLGAGAVAAADVPPRMIAVGVPAKAIRPNPRAQ